MEGWERGIRNFDRSLSRRMQRIGEKETPAGSECIHGLLQGTCSLCLGYPQSNKTGAGAPAWFRGGGR